MGTQNLTVDAKNSTVNNSATTTGTITIKDVSNSTWNENAQGNKIVFNDTDAGTKFVVDADATVASLTVNGPAVVTNNGTITELAVAESVTTIVNGTAPTKITGTGTITGDALPTGDKTAELTVDGLTNENLKFLVFGLPETGAQQASTLEQVKNHIDTKYSVTFNSSAITVETDGTLKVTGPLLSTEDWNKVKTNGDKALPYKITVLKGDKTSKVAKIAMYQDGTVKIEDLQEQE